VEVVMTSPAQSIGELVEPLVTTSGLELWDVEVNARAVRVLVDRPGGVDLDALTDLARLVSGALDGREELTPGNRYELEVSSPGVERSLRTPTHFQRFIGTEVNVKLDAPVDGSRRLQGVLLSADESGITVALAGGPTTIEYDRIQKAHTVLVWGAASKTRAAKTTKSQPSEPMKDLAR
jgi:ribosome maturation factor RimP